jgi:hypothetical protein
VTQTPEVVCEYGNTQGGKISQNYRIFRLLGQYTANVYCTRAIREFHTLLGPHKKYLTIKVLFSGNIYCMLCD